ncbi:hypothetical protein TNCV_2490241 [Trichonephila clavipes]|nr:hypothetical protein TNCV_2490241 [Trichonephila clavipes]
MFGTLPYDSPLPNQVKLNYPPIQQARQIAGSTSNGRHDPKSPSARCLHTVQEDTGAPSEGATCAWMAAEEATVCVHFLRCDKSSLTTCLSSVSSA